MKLFKIMKTEVHDHHIVIAVFGFFLLITYLNTNHDANNNCYLLEPDISCNGHVTVQRESIVNNATTQWVYAPFSDTAYHLDEFRQVNGFAHVECPPNNNTCTLHYDVYNGVVGFANTFGVIAHSAETVDRICWTSDWYNNGFSPDIYGCRGLPDWISVIIIWALLVFVPYYTIKHTIICLTKKKKR